MEPDSMGGVIARLDRAERDISENARARHEMRKDMATQEREIALVQAAVVEIRNDVGEATDQLKWVLRGLVGAIITFTGLIVTILVAVFSNA